MAILSIVFALVGAWTFFPQFRALMLLVGLLLVAGLIGFALVQGRRRTEPEANRLDSPVRAVEPPAAEPMGAAQLMEQIRSIDWFQFEKLVGELYRKQGYSVTRRGGANPDGGIDLIIEKNGMQTAVQCKQWKTWNVGVKAVREFLGALTDAGLKKGVFVTLCGYSGDAKRLAEKHGIEIVNETGLAGLLEAVGGRLDPELLAILRDPRKVCPRCEREMVLRIARKGRAAGRRFWGCSAYPKCGYTMSAR